MATATGRSPGGKPGRGLGKAADREAGRNTGPGPARGSGQEAGPDTGREPGRAVGRRVPGEAGRESGRGTGGIPGREDGRDTGTVIKREPGRKTGRKTGRDAREESGHRPRRQTPAGPAVTPADAATGGRTPLDPLFTALDASAFTGRHMARLAVGTLAAVRVPGFLDGAACRAVTEALGALPTAPYDPARVPTPVVRFGPALNDYRLPGAATARLDGERYWPDAQTAREEWREWSRASALRREDPVAYALDRLGAAWGTPVAPATVHGRAAFGGTLREINAGLLMHYDDINREFPDGLFDQEILAQLAFNLYVSVAPGGATTVWRHRWDPADERHREAYGYRHAAVAGRQRVDLPPHLGDALLFDPAHFHAVARNTGEGRRIAFAFFLGLTTGGSLVVWS
ncbi:hypothetical protein I3F58_22880 [Streptomyces sp. MUM 203J]|uniref:hypothetical protein n=1 Tax=Streptomyces sp. MUM 203J TaxID=2791990 RepID=UPI001F044953|nr:hypothetical protein [Streptomyces sp. MUM 203J]MCH0542343.1 hypothetical protein [Streptomyces sp. MUM 203J]